MGTRSSPALLDFKPMRDLQAFWLTCSKTESINLTRSFLPVGQEDVGNEAGPSEGLGWISAGLPARYNYRTSQASDVLHHGVHIISSGLAFPCCISVKPKYLCLFSTQFILNGKGCCQHVKIYVTWTWICQTWTLAKLSEAAEQGTCLQAGFLFLCCQGTHVYLREFICGKEKSGP